MRPPFSSARLRRSLLVRRIYPACQKWRGSRDREGLHPVFGISTIESRDSSRSMDWFSREPQIWMNNKQYGKINTASPHLAVLVMSYFLLPSPSKRLPSTPTWVKMSAKNMIVPDWRPAFPSRCHRGGAAIVSVCEFLNKLIGGC